MYALGRGQIHRLISARHILVLRRIRRRQRENDTSRAGHIPSNRCLYSDSVLLIQTLVLLQLIGKSRHFGQDPGHLGQQLLLRRVALLRPLDRLACEVANYADCYKWGHWFEHREHKEQQRRAERQWINEASESVEEREARQEDDIYTEKYIELTLPVQWHVN